MKQIVSLTLYLAMLLSLCACGNADGPETGSSDRMLQAEPFTATVPVQPTESITTPTETDTTTAPTDVAETVFEPVTIYEDAEYGTVLLTDLYHGYGSSYTAEFTVTNHSEGNLHCAFGSTVYINDIMVDAWQAGQWEIHEVEKGQEQIIHCVIPLRWLDDTTADIGINITYDNGETGVYQERIELVNDVFNIHASDNAVSEKYTAAGDEVFAGGSGDYKLIVTDCGEDTESYNQKYWVSLYLENTSDNYVVFAFEDYVSVSSDQQDTPYYLASGGMFYLDFGVERITLAPGKGCYLVASVSKERVDHYAKDSGETVTVNIPVWVWDYPSDNLAAGELAYSWREDHVIKIAREQFTTGG